MTTREKIIVGMMCVTIAYGAYELLSSGTPNNKPQSPATDSTAELQSLVTDISRQLSTKGKDQDRKYLVELEATNWSKDPFIQSTQPLRKTLEPPKEASKPAPLSQGLPQLSYSGYLEVGSQKLAIINGQEYAKGEALGTTGYYVRSISARHVMVGKVNGSDTIRLPLQEAAD